MFLILLFRGQVSSFSIYAFLGFRSSLAIDWSGGLWCSPRTGRGRGACRLVHCYPFDHLRKRCKRRVLRRILDHRRTIFCLWTKLFLSVFKTCCASIQNFLRWKRKFPTLEIEISYVGNSFFLGRVWRRQMAALPFPVPHSPFPSPCSLFTPRGKGALVPGVKGF